jgi:hypothetical protein
VKGHTIQNRVDEGERISVYCHNPRYHHGSKLDLLKLRDKLGPDHGAMHNDLAPKLRCSVCGSKNVGIIIHQNTEREPDLRSPFQR